MKPAPDFDRLAHLYRWMELVTFGPWLGWARCAFLGRLCACRRALVLGDGDGRFTARMLEANSVVRIDAVDASRAMLASLARRAGPQAARVRTHCADVRLWQPPAPHADFAENLPYDLIATHFFLDCLTTQEVQSLAEKLRGSVSPSAAWVVSEFAVPPGWFGRLVASPLIFALYRAFGWLTGLAVRSLPDHAAALGQAGFTLQERRAWLAGLLVSERWSAGPAPGAASPTAKEIESPIEMLQSC